MINWNEIKFRASSWGNLLTEPVTKADKEAGKLSKSCIMELIKIYNMEVYGRKKDVVTNKMDKGKIGEPESIKLFSNGIAKHVSFVSVYAPQGCCFCTEILFISISLGSVKTEFKSL